MMALVVEQLLNGLQYGVILFLLASGLTLIFGVMGIINLAHGSLYMVGAYAAAAVTMKTGSFLLGGGAGLLTGALCAVAIEYFVLRRIYDRDHLDQVLATFALILIFNQLMTLVFGRQPLFVAPPSWLGGSIEIAPGLSYSAYRTAIIVTGVGVAIGLDWLVNRTRIGMLVRAGATNREMVRALGVDINLIYTVVFGAGGMLAALAGVLTGPLLAVQVGMGERILIVAFVVVVVGRVGSIRGAFLGALAVGVFDTLARAFLPTLLLNALSTADADALGIELSSMGAYLLMALVLLMRPKGALATGRH